MKRPCCTSREGQVSRHTICLALCLLGYGSWAERMTIAARLDKIVIALDVAIVALASDEEEGG